jgi:hypothetical protein
MKKSAWRNGVQMYANDLLESLRDNDLPATQENLLNGAQSWEEYSSGGCSLIYNSCIAERLCSPSELKRVNGGERNPNSRESWLDCQARALTQAARIVLRRK